MVYVVTVSTLVMGSYNDQYYAVTKGKLLKKMLWDT